MAGARFVAVPVSAIEDFLFQKSGRFERRVQGREVVLFVKHSKCSSVRVEVFTSASDGAETVRGAGTDAVKVLAVYDDGRGRRFPLVRAGESTRVLRVGDVQSVVNRIYTAVMTHYALGGRWIEDKFRGVDPTTKPDWRGESL